jgi:hypothetical protein
MTWNSNPNRCSSRKKKQMNAITKTVLAAVLVALGLTLTTWAAEPPKPEPQKGTAATGVAEVSRSAPVEGEPVDMSRWAYVFRQGANDNPWETRWLDPMDKMLWGALWEQGIEVARVEVEFPANVVVSADDLRVMAVKPWTGNWFFSGKGSFDWLPKSETHWTPPAALKPSTSSASAPAGKNVLAFDGIGLSSMKLAVFNIGDKRLPVPQVRVYGNAPASKTQAADLRRWTKPQVVEIEWGFDDKAVPVAVEGRLEAYWGEILRIEPLEEGNGLKTQDGLGWREEVVPGPKRRGLRATVAAPTSVGGPQNATVSLRTGKSSMAFSMNDLERGPILVPSIDMYVVKAGGVPARKFQQELAAKNPKTLRQQLCERQPEQSYAGAMKGVFGDHPLPPFPEPPYTSPMQIDVPEKQLVSQWRLGAWHLKRWSRKVDPRNPFKGLTANGDWDPDANIWEVNIWPPRNGGVAGAALGAETYKILMALDMLGVHDVAEGGLNFWLKARKNAGGNFKDGGAVRVNYFSDFDGLLLLYGYDLKHTEGHADILRAAALHARMTEDRAWVKAVAPKLRATCDFIVRQRKAWNAAIPEGVWAKGLMCPMSAGDGADLAWYYALDETFCVALKQVAQILVDNGFDAADLLREAESYRQDIRAAAEVSISRTPVIRGFDGTCQRFIPWAPYLRRRSGGMDVLAGAFRFGRDGIFAFDEPIMQEMLDSPVTAELMRSGHGSQVGHESHWKLFLLNDDVPPFLYTMYNGYAADIRPWGDEKTHYPYKLNWNAGGGKITGDVTNMPPAYTFSEHPKGGIDLDKTFETAAFLERVRSMLVMEIGDVLWLARATPRVWLEQGKKISVKNAPTYYGTVAYEIVSDVDNGKISATIEMPIRLPAPDKGGQAGKAPKEVVLRFRHPKSTPIKGVIVNGKPWTSYDKDKETITLKDLTGTVTVTAQY